MKNINIDHSMSTFNHYQTNRQVEHQIETIQECLRNLVNRGHNYRSKYLRHFQYAINIAPSGMSPYFLYFGHAHSVFEYCKLKPTTDSVMDRVVSDIVVARKEAIFVMNHARLWQNIRASKHHWLAINLYIGIVKLLINSKPYHQEKDRSQKHLPSWLRPFSWLGPFEILDINKEMGNYHVNGPEKWNLSIYI